MSAREGVDSRPWLKRRLQSFTYAARGVWHLRLEPNARVHAFATFAVLIAAVVSRLSPLEWALVVFAIALVFAAEALNTALEHLADATVPERHPLVGAAKDLAAGAVLICALGAAVVGVLVLGPHLLVIAARGFGD
jgi:diacylglycerol kinase